MKIEDRTSSLQYVFSYSKLLSLGLSCLPHSTSPRDFERIKVERKTILQFLIEKMNNEREHF